jgi:hypothetical protein
MRTRFRRVLSIVAITVIALHTALWGGTATHAATAAVDPFSVICHSGESASPEQAPASPLSAPSHACDHCNLCGSTPPAAAAPGVVVVQLVPRRPSYALEPAPAVPHGGVEVALKGARGPPVFA